MKSLMRCICVALIAVVSLCPWSVPKTQAGTTGKISGQIVDAETGDALPGANVVIQGTTMGAATAVDGSYFVINVPPGAYTVTATMIGYSRLNVTNVRVNVDRTTVVDFSLKTEVITGEEVTVVSEREVVPMDVSASKVNIQTSEAVETAPIQDLKELFVFQAGIEPGASAEDLIVRGGGGDQVGMMIDGPPG